MEKITDLFVQDAEVGKSPTNIDPDSEMRCFELCGHGFRLLWQTGLNRHKDWSRPRLPRTAKLQVCHHDGVLELAGKHQRNLGLCAKEKLRHYFGGKSAAARAPPSTIRLAP